MHKSARLSALLPLTLFAALLCACHDPAQTVNTSVSSQTVSSQTVTSEMSATTASSETTSDTSVTTPTETTGELILTSPSGTPSTTPEKLNTAKGKFNYVLKNKSWKFDGEMYYHKYKDGTTVYYDKEAKSYFLIDSKGQGWYYDPDLNDFVKDE